MKSHLLFSLLSVSALWSAPVQRTVLGLYNSQEGPYVVSDYNLVHRAAQMPLNYLGLSVRLHDIAWGIPPEQALEDVFAILCWTNTESSVNADTLCRWLTEQATNGKRLVLMGELPFVFNSVTREPIDRSLIETLFHAIGLRFEGNETSNPLVIKIDWADREMIGFERPLEPGDIPSYRQVRISDPQVQPYLLYSRSDLPESSSVAIATTPNGGYAAPDTTTLFGQRIYYSHIDGDGLRNLSDIDPSKSSGQIIFEEVLQRYPLPFTASFITAEVDPAYIATSDTVQLARSIFQLENVETGSHGFTHPLNWNLGITVFAIPGYSVELDPETAKGANELVESGYKQGARIVVPPKEWYRREIVDSSNYLSSNIAPKEKPIRLYQWTGNCKPPGPAIRMAHDAGLIDINGGDGRLDRAYPTYTKMAPLSRHIDWERQTYTSNANEDIYTNGWHGPYYAQIYVIDTFKQTEIPTLIDGVPRRVAPMNLYFHYYSGEKADSLYAIRYVLEYILATPCIPIFTTHYCEIIDGFYSGEIERLEKNGWRFRHYGKCQTVRLDHTSLWPDLDRSEGVLGYRKWEDYLYIHLTEEGEATLYLSEQETQKPYLVEATAPLWKLRLLPNKISMTSKALGNARFKFANMLPNKTYSVRQKWSSQEEITGVEFTIRSDSYGVLEILAPVHGESELEIQQVAAPS